MPNSATIVGDQTVLFGTTGYYSGSGIVVSGNKKLDGDKISVLDENGFEIATIYFNDRNEFSFEMIVKTAAPALARGALITVAGVANAEVQNTEEMWKQGDKRMFRVDAIKCLGKTFA